MADFIAKYHDVPVTLNPILQTLVPYTLFQRIGGFRSLGVSIVNEHRGNSVILIAHESIASFIGRYVDVNFQKISNFSYIELDSIYDVLKTE